MMAETQLAVRVIIFSCEKGGGGWEWSPLSETGIMENTFLGAHFDGDASSTTKSLGSFARIILQMAIAVWILSFHICTLQLLRAIRTYILPYQCLPWKELLPAARKPVELQSSTVLNRRILLLMRRKKRWSENADVLKLRASMNC